MFVGLNDSFTLFVSEFPELKPNSIYFTDIFSPQKCEWWRSVCCLSEYDVGIFDYQRQKFYPCYSPQEEHNHEEESSEGEEDNQEESSEDGEEDNDIGSEEEDYIYDEQHINVEESSEEEEDNDGVFDGEEEEDNDGSVFYEEKYGPLPTIVWFRPSSQL